MPGKPSVLVWAEADSEQALKARYLAEAHPQRRQWLHGLWLLRRWGRCGVRLRQCIQRRRKYLAPFLAVEIPAVASGTAGWTV